MSERNFGGFGFGDDIIIWIIIIFIVLFLFCGRDSGSGCSRD